VTRWGAFRDDDVPAPERPCYNECVQRLDIIPFLAGAWGGITSGIAAGIVVGSPGLGVGAVPGAVIGGVVSFGIGWWGSYQTAIYIDKECKEECHKKACKANGKN
jgi:hypothetical protein